MNITPTEIKDAWRYADAAYKSPTELKKIFGKAIAIIDPLIRKLGDVCYIINEADRVVMMFPGSNDAIDWIRNIDHYQLPNGMNRGFMNSLDLMAQEIMERLIDMRPAHILITGHSRGGALADIFLERYAAQFDLDVEIDCITFAQPRIATSEYYAASPVKDQLRVRYLRVLMANDEVTHLPPSKYGYVHHGQSLMLGRRLSVWQRLRRYFKGKAHIFDDHRVETYRAAINKLSNLQ